jgi:hypothetical protein
MSGTRENASWLKSASRLAGLATLSPGPQATVFGAVSAGGLDRATLAQRAEAIWCAAPAQAAPPARLRFG